MALEDYKRDMERCARCSLCKWPPLAQIKSWRFSNVCPSIVKSNFHAYSGGGKLAIGLAMLEDRITEYTDEMLDMIYKCPTCGACDSSCKYNADLEVLQVVYELRAKCVEDGQLLPAHMFVIEGLRKEDNMLQRLKAERGKWAEGLDVKDLTREKADVVYHAGCQYSFDPELQDIARDTITILRKAGVDVGIMGGEETCCGGRAYEMGYQGEFIKYAESNIETWATAGVRTVVTSCADCYGTFKKFYPTAGKEMKFRVLHVTEYLDQLIKEGEIRFTKKIPIQVTYHDPCHLGRLSEPYIPWKGREEKVLGQFILKEPEKEVRRGLEGIYQPPRDVLNSIPGLELFEMERIKEYAWCCGAGGGVKEAYTDFALWTALERVEEAKASGAEAIVTACPWCERNFKDAIKESGQKIAVYDLIELVQQAI